MDLEELDKLLRGKRVQCRLTSGEWFPGKVRFVSRDGFVYVDLLQQDGQRGYCFGYSVERLSQSVRLA